MTDSVYFRLAGPFQSWAGPAITGNFVRTEPRPTHSGLVGLVAGACGFLRGEWPDWLNSLCFQVREDNRGVLIDDFQTINPRDTEMEFRSRLLLAMGKRPTNKLLTATPDGQGLTSLVQRTYLAGAEFIVQVASDEFGDILLDGLKNPRFSTYLGRKAFAPAFPFFLGSSSEDLLTKIPTVDSKLPDGQENKILRVFQLGPGCSTSPMRISVPVVSTRDSWLNDTKKLFLAPH
ncbi:CRISPR-associated protein Cas5 [Corynebacterium mustelae]|uniref:CRISPR-associated protein Cas5 n=1 Tax=Corynebacterium mustelae TaxID=571915 RepID=A0A0G3GZW8_9CORY|nr:type I-E CRISPR-associated protein Cas5/CasD [Corynebacterium mustelae]AKK04392.1 CRISPR-associated protein Cas5 [Corynebacterium mustelae]